MRLLPHEVRDVEEVIHLLEREDADAYKNWETRYFLLLWMSMLVLIPFDLKRFDGGQQQQQQKGTLMRRISDLIRLYLSVNNKCLDAAAFLASKFFTRPEVSWSLGFPLRKMGMGQV